MVKINKSGYTPITQDSSLQQLEGKIDVATNQASGLVDASLRNVTSTQNQAARDRLQANEDAFRMKIGLSDAYFITKQKYMDSVRTLTKIDEINAEQIKDAAAKAHVLQSSEKIKLNTAQFYEDTKQKDPLNLVEKTQAFINSQIEEAVKTAPNDKAVLDLYADMSKYKVQQIGDAIKDKATFRSKQIDLAINESKDIAAAHIRMNPSQEMFTDSLDRFSDIASILKSQGFSDQQLAELQKSYNKEMALALVGGLSDYGQVNSIKSVLKNDDILAALGDKAQEVIKNSKDLEKKLIEQHSKELNKVNVLNLYESGKSPDGIDGAADIVYEQNINVLQDIESKIQQMGAANASTMIEQYFTDRNQYIPKKTMEYMSNKALYGSDEEMATYAAATVKMLNNKDTARQFSKLSTEVKADILSTAFYLESLGDIKKAKTIVSENAAKLNQLGGMEAIQSIKTRAYEDLFGKQSTSFDRGEQVLKELKTSEWIYNDVGEQDIELLGSRFDQAFNEMLIRSGGNATAAYRTALEFIKTTNLVTDVNGYDQIMKNSPTELGILDTQEGKDEYKLAYTNVMQGLSKQLNMSVVNERFLRGEGKEIKVDIAPIPFYTGNELDGTVNYALVNGLTGESILVDGMPKYLTVNVKTFQDKIDQKNRARRAERERLLDLSNKAWSKLERNVIKQNKPVVVGK